MAPTSMFATHSWGGYHWARTANPFTIKLGDNLSSADWEGHLAQTSSDWSKSNVMDTTIVPGGATGRKCRPVSGTVQVCNASYGNNGWLGLAQIWLASGTLHITQGTSKMNDTYFDTSTYNNANEREHVMCQEVGHTFGLDHQDTSGASLNTCMDYFSNTGSNAGSTLSTTPNQHDYDELGIIYSHLDSSTTIAFSPFGNGLAFGGEDEDLDGPNAWGHVVDATVDGRTTTYERDFPNGKLLTFVIWADRAHGNGNGNN